jgi:hypothetical protein
VAIFQAEAREDHVFLIGHVIAVGVFHEPEVRRSADVYAAIADLDGGRKVEAVGEDGDLVGAAVAVGVF